MNGPNPHAAIDEGNMERDRKLAALIRRNPSVIGRAQHNLQQWEAHWKQLNPAWEEWRTLLRMLTAEQVADFLESATPKANRLRQSSPFLGVLQDHDPVAATHAT